MAIISLQILLINFIVAGIITGVIYISCRRVRSCNPILLFIISSLGTFLGTILAMMLPSINLNSDSILVNNLMFSIPGISLSLIFSFIWIKGSRTEGYV